LPPSARRSALRLLLLEFSDEPRVLGFYFFLASCRA
jgi:hypothetical protein